ncbi:hypothetical protein DVH24_025449 [Malus domestica]|uniref:DYW domain-containing protein n=1 Tax=Malus domestica TaxID=3750 RepID=A0A498HKA0_MALDO|nr:hypothetical protein DVH24_025449 [Malus domestica]
MSKCSGKVIIVRDNNRFHRFEDGKCTCEDYMCTMSNLIKTRRAMTSTPNPTTTPSPTTTPTTAITAPAEMDHRPINLVDPVGPPVPQAQASSTSLLALPVSTQCIHQRPHTTN